MNQDRIKFFDIHAHLHFNIFQNQIEEKIKENLNEGVFFLNVGTSKKTSLEAVKYSNFNGVWASIGLHPHHTWTDFEDEFEGKIDKEEFFEEQFYESLVTHPKVVAIGEFGLDYFYFPENSDVNSIKKIQWQVCEAQIKFAKKHNKSLMIHLRGKDYSVFADFYSLIKNYLPLNINIHFFSGDIFWAKKFLDLGCYFSFGGVITFKNAEEKRKVIAYLPLDRILTETDSPYVSPEPFRGQINEPKNVKLVVEKIAEIKKEDILKVKEIIFYNSCNYLGLKATS